MQDVVRRFNHYALQNRHRGTRGQRFDHGENTCAQVFGLHRKLHIVSFPAVIHQYFGFFQCAVLINIEVVSVGGVEKTENRPFRRDACSFLCGKRCGFDVDKPAVYPIYPRFPRYPKCFHFTYARFVDNLSFLDARADAFDRVGKRLILAEHLRNFVAGGNCGRVIVAVEQRRDPFIRKA